MERLIIKEVSPRDGLQIVTPVSLDIREQFIRKLISSGIEHIEVGSFVNNKKVPQMAGTKELILRLTDVRSKAHLFALIFTAAKMKEVIESRLTEISIIVAASETFNQKNANCSTKDALKRASEIITIAKSHMIKVRAYVAMSFGCPYKKEIPLKKVLDICDFYISSNVDELVLADTIGYGVPRQIKEALSELKKLYPIEKIGMHLHDTYGTAENNTLEALDQGVRIFDSSVGGLGGCPFASGAKGNISTEKMLEISGRLGFFTGIDKEKLIDARSFILSCI